MTAGTALLLGLLILCAAMLYSSVGHGGASAYLAVMALFGPSPAFMRPTALVLNLFVAGIAAVQFARAGWFRWSLFWPFAVASIPMAFLGGRLSVPDQTYRRILGGVLLFAAVRLALRFASSAETAVRPLPVPLAMALGAVIGVLSGLTGVGGGIFLSPLLLVGRWADPKPTAAVSAAFIWVNSLAGLLGRPAAIALLPPSTVLW
ncbi:MAG: sulfite exporter TauE/SafE family protein, partial [Thermoanaerobaculia bacterium]